MTIRSVLWLAIAGAPAVASADAPRPGEGPEQWIELAFPDFRYEFTTEAITDGRLVASFPIPFVFDPWRLGYSETRTQNPNGEYGGCNGYSAFLMPAFVLEPQWRIGNNALRMLASARFIWLMSNNGPHFVVEGNGVAGTDAYGAGFGVGFGLAGRLSLLYRSTWTTEGHRHDVALDVHMFSVPSGKYASLVYEAKDAIHCYSTRPPIGSPPEPIGTPPKPLPEPEPEPQPLETDPPVNE